MGRDSPGGDIETGEVLFEWRSLEHVGIDESYATLPEDPDLPYDYFHINSIAVDHDRNLLVGARNTWCVCKVDRQDGGGLLWRLDGKRSDFEMGEGTQSAFQHDARRQEDGTHPEVHDQSRGIVIELHEKKMRAKLLREYTSPQKSLSTSQGNMQLLPDANAFVGWGSAPLLCEFARDGELLFEARYPPECESYRAFRFPWSGRPTDVPAVAVEQRPEGKVALYASWNGATEVASWEVVSGPTPGLMAPLGSVPREGFETAMLAQIHAAYVAVRAKDRSGEILGTSAPVEI